MASCDSYNELSDTSLFCLIKQCDHDAFTELYNRYSSVLYLFIYFIIKDKEQTSDLVQNIFMSIWENRKRTTININVKNYLYTSAKNSVINFLRTKKTNQDYIKTVLTEQKSKNIPSVEQIYEKAELNRLIELSIQDLQNDTKQKIIKLRREGLSNKEVAKNLNIPENTVRIYYSQSIRDIRNHLKKLF